MNTVTFKQRFQLSPQPTNADRYCIPYHIAAQRNYRDSAVLVPLIEINNQLHLILTKRPAHLKHHPGQTCFPGGKVSDEDDDLLATALRETREEIGILNTDITILGQLPVQYTYTGFQITPYVGLVNHDVVLDLDHNEVAHCFTSPISTFLDPSNTVKISTSQKGIDYQVLLLNDGTEMIWGVTASIINVLCRKIGTII
ncbi:MAG: CoA pyrophosphatase [Parashewanella sp.]